MPHKYLRGPTGHLRVFIAAIFEMINRQKEPPEDGFAPPPPWPYLCASANQARNLRAEFYRYRAKLRKAGEPNEDLEQVIIKQAGERLMVTHTEFDPAYVGAIGSWDYGSMTQVDQKEVEAKVKEMLEHKKVTLKRPEVRK